MNKEEELSQDEILYKKIEFLRGSLNQFFELYDWLKINHPTILRKGIDAIQKNE